ncbi:MAG: DUF2442 domain-containing protein [Candidatus Riflebacteria bacterium]|nr:DUF2442 domain-containing protein [Candidatus Riflebacteria bacterium]
MKGTLIKAAKVVADQTIAVEWGSGKVSQVDFGALISSNPHFRPLAGKGAFTTIHVDEWGHTLSWACGADIGSESVWRMAQEQAGKAWSLAEFHAWMKRNSLSLSSAAEALKITRRAVIYYHQGHRPIPRWVEVACLGWEALKRERAGLKRKAA